MTEALTDAFFRIHSGLKREGPGDEESLEWALTLAGTPTRARILDAGCGPGADLAMLSRLRPGARLVGMDLHPDFIRRIRAEQPHVTAVEGDMLAPDGMFDLIWSAGAAYGPGVEAALAAWSGHLTPGGAVAFSDCLWRSSQPSAAARDFWSREYPAMCDLPSHLSRLDAGGWRVKGARWLGDAAWEAYYAPLAARLANLRQQAEAEGDEAMLTAIAEHQAEIDIWRNHGAEFGYYLTVVTPA